MLLHPGPSIRLGLSENASPTQSSSGWMHKPRKFRMPVLIGPSRLYQLLKLFRTALGKPVSIDSVAKSILYLASEVWSGHVTGQVLNVDSGKQGKVMWTQEECDENSGSQD